MANLNTIAEEVTAAEGLKTSVSIGQVKEIIGIMGDRWRNMPIDKAQAEFAAIITRAGLRSQARD